MSIEREQFIIETVKLTKIELKKLKSKQKNIGKISKKISKAIDKRKSILSKGKDLLQKTSCNIEEIDASIFVPIVVIFMFLNSIIYSVFAMAPEFKRIDKETKLALIHNDIVKNSVYKKKTPSKKTFYKSKKKVSKDKKSKTVHEKRKNPYIFLIKNFKIRKLSPFSMYFSWESILPGLSYIEIYNYDFRNVYKSKSLNTYKHSISIHQLESFTYYNYDIYLKTFGRNTEFYKIQSGSFRTLLLK